MKSQSYFAIKMFLLGALLTSQVFILMSFHEREKAMQDAKPPVAAETVPNEAEARLRRLELMLNKLTQALGV